MYVLTIYADPCGNSLLHCRSDLQTFCVEIFPIASRPLWKLTLSPSGHLLSEYMHFHWLRCSVSLSGFDVSKFRDQCFPGSRRLPSVRTGRKIIIYFCLKFKVDYHMQFLHVIYVTLCINIDLNASFQILICPEYQWHLSLFITYQRKAVCTKCRC